MHQWWMESPVCDTLKIIVHAPMVNGVPCVRYTKDGQSCANGEWSPMCETLKIVIHAPMVNGVPCVPVLRSDNAGVCMKDLREKVSVWVMICGLWMFKLSFSCCKWQTWHTSLVLPIHVVTFIIGLGLFQGGSDIRQLELKVVLFSC